MDRPTLALDLTVDGDGEWHDHRLPQDGMYRSSFRGTVSLRWTDLSAAGPRPSVPFVMPLELSIPIPQRYYQRRRTPTPSSSSSSCPSLSVDAPIASPTPIAPAVPDPASPPFVVTYPTLLREPSEPALLRPRVPIRRSGARIRVTPRKSDLRRIATFTVPREMVGPSEVAEADLEQLPDEHEDDAAVPDRVVHGAGHDGGPLTPVPPQGWRAWPVVSH